MTRSMLGLAVGGLDTLAAPALAHHAPQSRMAFLESLTWPDGESVKIWFGDPNAN